MTAAYTYDRQARRESVTKPMPNGQSRLTTSLYDYVNDPETGVSFRTSTSINNVLVDTSYRSIDGYRSRNDSFGVLSSSSKTYPVDEGGLGTEDDIPIRNGAWTVTSIHSDGTRTITAYAEGRAISSGVFRNTNPPTRIYSTSRTYDAFGRTLTEVAPPNGARALLMKRAGRNPNKRPRK